MRQVMLAQRDFNFHPRSRVITNHFNNATDWLRVFARLLNDFNRYHLTRPGIHGFFPGYQNILADTPVLRLHKQNSMISMKSSHQLRYATLKHFDNSALPAPTPIHARFPHHDVIAMQHLMHFLGAQKHIGATVIRDQEAEAVCDAPEPCL